MADARRRPEQPWRRETSDDLGEKAARTFEHQWVSARLLRLHGPCPRCHHAFNYDRPMVVTRSATPFETVTVYCQCGPHPGAPEGRLGCGAYWELDVPRPSTTIER